MNRLSISSSTVIPLFEEHGEVLAHWAGQRWRRATLICLDRHLDLKVLSQDALERIEAAAHDEVKLASLNRKWPFEDAAGAHYGLDNFLYAAFRLGWIGRLVWVHPRPLGPDRNATLAGLEETLLLALSLVGSHGQEIIESFRRTPNGPEATVAGVTVHLTLPEWLPSLNLPPDTLVDVDLDFFGTETGQLLRDPALTAQALSALGLRRLVSLTASVSSGFLSPRLRWVGQVFARSLDCHPVAASRRRNPAAGLLRTLSAHRPISHASTNRLWSVLPHLGGPGWSLLSVIMGQSGNDTLEAYAYAQARCAGDGAHWPAYMAGLRKLGAGRPAEALTRFEQCEGSVTDAIQLHSVSLRALCLAQTERHDEALTAALRAVALTPLRREPCRVGALSARRCGRIDVAEWFDERANALQDLWTSSTLRGME